MHVGDEVIGILMGMTPRRRLFTVGEMELLYTISNQAAVAIYNAIQYRNARIRAHEMSRYFRRIAHALGSSFDSRDLPQVIADLAIEIMRADRCTVYGIDGDHSPFGHAVGSALPHSRKQRSRSARVWLAGSRGEASPWSLQTSSTTRAGMRRPVIQREHLASYLAVPLKAGRRTVGCIEIYTQQPREFTREEVQLLSTFARRARVAERMLERA